MSTKVISQSVQNCYAAGEFMHLRAVRTKPSLSTGFTKYAGRLLDECGGVLRSVDRRVLGGKIVIDVANPLDSSRAACLPCLQSVIRIRLARLLNANFPTPRW